MMQPDSKRPVTLEDILRLKRAERPPAEFWTQFDRELRAKQLSALVEKRPWWKTLSFAPAWTALRRYHLPLGATAVLAVTIFSVREYRAPKTAPSMTPVAAAEISVPTATVAVAVSTAVPAPHVVEAAVVQAVGADDVASTHAEPAVLQVAESANHFVLSSAATPDGDITPLITMAGVPGSEDSTSVSPSARLIADNLAALQSDDSVVPSSLLGGARAFEVRTVARNKPVEPLAQMRVPSGSRRSALITNATLVSTTAPVVTSERAARGLSDERLYERISRVNAQGAGMLVKF